MTRWVDRLVLSVVALGASSCAFDDGDPWARASFELSLGFEPGAARLDDEGRLVTPGDWAIALETPIAHVDSVTLTMAGEAGTLSFDPAEPPPGYSLCHNGHCHADDGRLVDYEDIELELATACPVPVGTELYWTALPDKCSVVVATASTSEPFTVRLETRKGKTKWYPEVGDRATYSPFTPSSFRSPSMPDEVPWTHQGPPTEEPGPEVPE